MSFSFFCSTIISNCFFNENCATVWNFSNSLSSSDISCAGSVGSNMYTPNNPKFFILLTPCLSNLVLMSYNSTPSLLYTGLASLIPFLSLSITINFILLSHILSKDNIATDTIENVLGVLSSLFFLL